MKRMTTALLLALALFLILPAQAAPLPTRQLLPNVQAAAATPLSSPVPASTCSDTVALYNRDVGSLAAILDNGHYYVALQDRQSGGKGYYMEHVGGALVNIVEMNKAGPAFAIDVVKVGSLALVPGRLYYTARKDGDTTGPYAVWCEEVP